MINWKNISPKEAVEVQKELTASTRLVPMTKNPTLVAGADISYSLRSNRLFAGIVVLHADTFAVVEKASAVMEVDFPYIPGFLSFREIPPLLEVWQKLKAKPDLVMLDGQGIAHPRRMGIATHFGILLQVPTIGCGKSRLIGTYQEPGLNKGDYSLLFDQGEVIGRVVRTRKNVKPMFISPGNLITHEESYGWAMKMSVKYRIPITTQMAHDFVNLVRKKEQEG